MRREMTLDEKVKEIADTLIHRYRIMRANVSNHSLYYLAYRNAMSIISRMPNNEGRDKLMDIFSYKPAHSFDSQVKQKLDSLRKEKLITTGSPETDSEGHVILEESVA